MKNRERRRCKYVSESGLDGRIERLIYIVRNGSKGAGKPRHRLVRIDRICVVGGAFSGAKSAIDHPDVQDKAALGAEAGRNFVRNNLGTIVIGACSASFLASVAISFSGILPWCKKPPPPPPLPPVP